jgi:glycosyltransferase involved in cell wall biosynthesis
MAAIRVYLLTCRRPILLRRALGSLLAQTFTDWVCELHNDAPEDDAPARALAEMAPFDVRFTYHRHDPPLGAVAAFNHCFRGGSEPYAALLEDDNWWEPALLATLHSALAGEPAATLAWANMRLWRENEDASWEDTGTTVWPAGAAPRHFDWPVLLQAFDGLHSNGAMVFRRPDRGQGTVPQSTPFAIIEPVRERALSGRLLFVPQVLANYAMTRRSARSGDRILWAEGQLLLAASFFEEVALTPEAWDELLSLCRQATPRRTSMLMLLALAGVRRREIMSRVAPADVARFAYDFTSSLRTNIRALGFRTAHARLWTWLRAETAARTSEARKAGRTALGAGSLFSKHAADRARR